jgi:ParB-like chromosome segregation protein Spo0J
MDKILWHTEKRKVKDLIPFKTNPRQISKDQLAHLKISLEKFDYVELVAIHPDNTIIAGHMRVKALIQLGRGKEEIEVRVPNRQLDDLEAKEYLIRSNKNTGEWDWDILADQFEVMDLHAWGFNADDLEFLIEKEVEESQGEPPDDGEKCQECGQKIRKKKNGT